MSSHLPYFAVRCRVHQETLENAIVKRVEGLKKKAVDDKVKRRAAEIYLECLEPLVPMKSGDLRSSAHVGKKYKGDYTVMYGNSDVQYAEAQFKGYNGRGPSRNFTTPGTHDHWNKHLSRGDRQAFYDLVAEEIMESIKHG